MRIDTTITTLPHVAVKRPGQSSMFEEWFLRELSMTRNIQVAAYSHTAPCRLIVGTDRIATVHRRLAEAARQHLPIRIIEPPLQFPRFQQVMQWHQYRETDPGLMWLRTKLRQAAQTLREEMNWMSRSGLSGGEKK
ncbi:hypothetical protein [Oceanobacter mangrovi]|uniref:hypothetical protein n=1 Tax=Oceanobacter mangrovi TaxID=2862510 RepID=UPI001C8D5032|nr:hypothetical protein [Oceanobacter mangrovi]